jgi:hypothetical protein
LTPLAIEKTFVNSADQSFDTSAKVVAHNASENVTLGLEAGEGLAFSEISQGVNITKGLRMSSNGKGFMKMGSTGNISSHLVYDDQRSFVNNTKVPVKFTADKIGYFTGTISIKTSQPENRVAEKWLELKYFFSSLY